MTVKAPTRPVSGPVKFTVVVKNNGPDDAKYTLNLALTTRRATCTAPWVGNVAGAELAKGKSRSEQFTATCTKAGGAKASLTATVAVKGTDPVSTNDSSTGQARIQVAPCHPVASTPGLETIPGRSDVRPDRTTPAPAGATQGLAVSARQRTLHDLAKRPAADLGQLVAHPRDRLVQLQQAPQVDGRGHQHEVGVHALAASP